MRAKRTLILFLTLITVAFIYLWQRTLPAQAAPLRYLRDSWTTEKGLPQNSVTSLLQSSDDYLWVGTFGGVARFDGVKFTIFDTGNSPGLKSNRVTTLFEDHTGVIWIGTEQNGLSSYDRNKFSTYTTSEGLPGNYIRAIAEDAEGALWIATSNGLARLAEGRFTTYTTRDGLIDDEVGLISAGRNDSLWFVSPRGLTRWQQGRFTAYPIPANIDFSVARSLFEGPDGSVWIAGLRVFARFRDGTFTFYSHPDGRQGPERVSIFKGPSGQLRFLLSSNVPDLTDEDVITDPSLMSWAGAKSILEDREGNLWIGSGSEGLYRYKHAQVTAYSADDGLTDDSVLVITGDGADGLWLGSHNLFHFLNQGFKKDARWVGAPGSTTGYWALLQDRDGTVWAGTYGGLHRFRDGSWTFYDRTVYGIAGDPVAAIYEDRSGNLWVGTGTADEPGGLYRFKDGAFTPFRAAEGLTLTDVRFITEDREGALWLGGASGMSRYKDKVFTNYTTEQGLSNNYVRDIYEDAEGTLWIGTYGGGLNRLKDGRFTPITTREGLFDNIVSRILEDDHGNLWMSCNRGIYRASRKELNELAEGRLKTITCISYGVADGMKSTETNGGCQPAGWKDREGKLWFPTLKGVVVVDPNEVNQLPPPVVVEQVLVDKTQVDSQQMINMRPGQSDLEIYYTGLSLTAPEKVRFKYKLEGYDRDWVDAKDRRIAYYSQVAPGTYTFKVMAANNDGVWSTQNATFQLTVTPPFWRTWWFTFWMALILAAIILGLYQQRIRQLQRARRAQEDFSKRLIASQEGERKRLAGELHDSLGQQLLVIKNRALLALHTSESHEEAIRELNEISDATSHALDEVREIAYNLRPFQLDQLGLTKALESMLKKVSQTSGIQFSIMIDLIDDLYSKEAEINIYRIVQESANNIVRHSEATEAAFEIKRNARGVTLRIHDNGKGFASDPTTNRPRREGLGIAGISERARILGGKHEFHSTPGAGTTIIIKLGLQNNGEGEAHID